MTDAPSPRPRPTPSGAARSTAPPPQSQSPQPRQPPVGGRAQRRRAEKDVGRRLRLRLAFQIGAGLLVAAGVATFVVQLTSSDDAATSAATTRPGTPHPIPAATGANLTYPTLVTAFLGGATSDLAAVTSYDYRSLDDALNAGLQVTTGAYRDAFRQALTGDLAAAVRAQHAVHTFDVLDLGIGAMTPNGRSAKVLVFGVQRVTDDNTGPEGDVSQLTLCATIRRDGNQFRISNLVEGADPGLPPGGPDLTVAVDAARSEVINVLSYRRDEFDTDLQRALDGATNPLRAQLAGDATHMKQAMIKGKYDTGGTVTAVAVVRSDTNSATVLVAADASRVVDGQDTPAVTPMRYEVTVSRTSTGWAASRLASVDGT